MNALLLVIVSLAAFGAAYAFYGKFLSIRILSLDPANPTPAHTRADGVDFVATPKSVLFGHHFASIAGLGPILGPAIGVIYGWLPAVLWVVFGSIFLGAVHDFTTLGLSLRHQGRTIGDLTEDLIGKRAKTLFLALIFFLLALAMGVFCLIIGGLFSKFRPEAVVPTFSLIVIAMGIGLASHKGKAPLGATTIVGVVLMLSSVWLGVKWPVTSISANTWIYILLGYAVMASVLPVWLLLQPRDYLNSFELYIGVALLLLGVVVLHPAMAAPAVHHAKNAPPMFPFLFILIACGAISGFHNLVSSGTTVRQLNSETDARVIGYGGMVAEGVLALLVIVACAAAYGSDGTWLKVYADFSAASGLDAKMEAFIKGSGILLASYGIPRQFAETFIAVVAVAFAMTTLDTGTRLLRFDVEELAKTFKLKPLNNRYAASLVAAVAIGYFALMKVHVPGGGLKPAGLSLWALFGASNQILGALGLLAVSVYLHEKKKPVVYTLAPMIFMMTVACYAMVIKIHGYLTAAHLNWSLIAASIVVLVIALWLVAEAAVVFIKPGRTRPLEADYFTPL